MTSAFSGRWGGQSLRTTVVASRKLTRFTHGITLRKPASFSFRPVQFTFLTLTTKGGPDTRPMSLASSPTRPTLEYAVRVSDSQYKRAFASLIPGDEVRVQGPYGDFVLEENRPAVLIAGGIGITPLKGMAEYASDKHLSVPVTLLYSNRSEDDIAYRDELEKLENSNPQFRILHTVTGGLVRKDWQGSLGRIDRRQILEATHDLEKPVFYVCGKPGMVTEMLNVLSETGVPEADMRVEAFRGYWS